MESNEMKTDSNLLWMDISTAPKDGTKIVGWLVPNEIDAPKKAMPWIIWWEEKQWVDGTGKKVRKPFGMWVTEEGWRNPMSYAPSHWVPKPQQKNS